MFTSPNRGDQGPNQYRTQDLVKGVGSVIFLRFYRCSEAELSQQSEPILVRVQGPPLGPGSSCIFNHQKRILPLSGTFSG